jgi:5-hydroxyisourate hydrolase
MEKGPITCHVLNTTLGIAGANIATTLHISQNSQWQLLGESKTDADGRIMNILPKDHVVQSGVYKLTFKTKEYFDSLDMKTFFPKVEVSILIIRKTNNKGYI